MTDETEGRPGDDLYRMHRKVTEERLVKVTEGNILTLAKRFSGKVEYGPYGWRLLLGQSGFEWIVNQGDLIDEDGGYEGYEDGDWEPLTLESNYVCDCP